MGRSEGVSRATLQWEWRIVSVTVQVKRTPNHLVPPLEPYVDTAATSSVYLWSTQRCTRMFVHVNGHVQSLHRANEVLKRAWWWVPLFLSKSPIGELIPQIFAYLNKGRGDDAKGNGLPDNYLQSFCYTRHYICFQCFHVNEICSCFIYVFALIRNVICFWLQLVASTQMCHLYKAEADAIGNGQFAHLSQLWTEPPSLGHMTSLPDLMLISSFIFFLIFFRMRS